MRDIKAVIFDMDGVIVDSEFINFHTMLAVLEKYGIDFDFKYYSKFPGGSCIEAFESVKRDFGADFDVSAMVSEFNNQRRITACKNGWTPVRNAVDTVKYCAGKYRLALASGSAPDIIENVTNSFNINTLFESKISGENIERCKPAPDIFLKSAENIGIMPQNCAVIEDSHNGVLAAKAADMMCIGVVNPNSGSQDLSAADFIVDNMSDIKKYL